MVRDEHSINRPRVSVDVFDYTFDHLADVIADFMDVIGLERYSLYVQDFGGPVGFSCYPVARPRPHAHYSERQRLCAGT
jgi:hypothetical protein